MFNYLGIFFFFQITISSFNDYFTDSNNCGKRYYQFPSKFYISFCNFIQSVSIEDHGGAIYHSNIQTQVVIENCLFLDQKVTNIGATYYSGGAIWCSSGWVVFSKNCASRCYTTSSTTSRQYGQFLVSFVPNGNTQRFFQNTVTLCYPFNTNAHGTSSVYFHSGNLTCSNNNVTNNYAYEKAGIYTVNIGNAIISFLHCSHNFPSIYYVIFFDGTNSMNNIIENSNFFNNSSPHPSIIFSSQSLTTIVNSIFLQNKNVLFGGKITVNNCFISEESTLSIGTYISVFASYGNSTTFSLLNYGTAFCETPIHPPTDPEFLDISPCATQYPPPTPVRTFPPSQTECFMSFNQNLSNSFNIVNLISLLFSQFWI